MARTAGVRGRPEELLETNTGPSVQCRVCLASETGVRSCSAASGAGRVASLAVEGGIEIKSRFASALAVEEKVVVRSAGEALIRQCTKASQTARVTDETAGLKIVRVARTGTCVGYLRGADSAGRAVVLVWSCARFARCMASSAVSVAVWIVARVARADSVGESGPLLARRALVVSCSEA